MKSKNPYKQTAQLPSWVLNVLKGLLVVVFLWQFNRQIPEDYWSGKEEVTPPIIESITFQQVLGTTMPIPTEYQYLLWGNHIIPYIQPTQTFSAPFYELSIDKIKQLFDQEWELIYKGQELDIIKINAVFLKEGALPVFCEEEGNAKDCLLTNLQKIDQNGELWLALETVQQKVFFSTIRIGQKSMRNHPHIEEAVAFWEKQLKKEKFKNLDNLTVEKPIFQHNPFLFKWGPFERPINRDQWETRIKIDTATFRKMLLHDSPPKLYKEGAYMSFNMGLGFWSKQRWTWDTEKRNLGCTMNRTYEDAPLIDTYPCLQPVLDAAKVGDVLSFSLYFHDDISDEIAANQINWTPDFILNGNRIAAYFNIELVADPIDYQHHPIQLTTSEFAFQLNNSLSQKAIVKMDTLNTSNKSLLDHYRKSDSANLIHIPNYKTIRRVVNQEDNFIDAIDIDETHRLIEKEYAVHTFPEFYDFDIFPPTIKSRGFSAVLDKTFYPLSEYVNYRDPFALYIGSEKVKVLQTNITLIPKEGPIIQYITDNPDRYDINSKIDSLSSESSIYFSNILFEKENGEQLAFPLAVAVHLK